MAEKGLTELHESGRGFIGSKPAPKFDTTNNGRPRVKFCAAFGKKDEQSGKFPSWRNCVGYGDIVEKLKGLKVGCWVRVAGWVSTEWIVDEYFKPVLDDKGVHKTREVVIIYKAEILEYERKTELQPALIV